MGYILCLMIGGCVGFFMAALCAASAPAYHDIGEDYNPDEEDEEILPYMDYTDSV